MSLISLSHIELKGVAAAVPKNTVSNFDLQEFEEKELNKLIETIGIETRRESEAHQCASDLCYEAALQVLKDLNWNKEEIGVMVFVSQTPDYMIPGTSFHLKQRLGLNKNCIVFDINQGCAGYVYGLSVIGAFMNSFKIEKGLLLLGDCITKLIAKNNKSLRPLFSDCGTATALLYNEQAEEMKFHLDSDGRAFESIMVKNGGGRELAKASNGAMELSMKGLEVFNFTLTKVIPNIEALLHKHEKDISKLDFVFFHQANAIIIESLRKKLKLESSKVPSSLKYYGNTSGASIPLTMLTFCNGQNRLSHKTILLSGFGVGLSIGSVIIKTNDFICSQLKEVA